MYRPKHSSDWGKPWRSAGVDALCRSESRQLSIEERRALEQTGDALIEIAGFLEHIAIVFLVLEAGDAEETNR